MKTLVFVLLVGSICLSESFSQVSKISSSFKIARLKYTGGGDWYNDPQEEVNLLKFVRQNSLIDADPVYEFVDVASDKFFTYPFIFLTGHGNMTFTDLEVKRLRIYLENGGFV